MNRLGFLSPTGGALPFPIPRITMDKKQLPSGAELVLQTIRKRTRLNPIKAEELKALFGVRRSQVRKIVHYYRFVEMYPIASGNDGYYMARTYEEWNKTVSNLKSRAISMLEGLNEITRKNFSGQQNLFEN